MAEISSFSRWFPESPKTLSLEVTNYLQFKGVNAGDYVSSRVFTVGGYDWEIRFYPQGIDEDCSGYASALLWYLGLGAEDVGAKFTLSMLEKKSQAEVASFEARKRFFRNPKYRRWGYPKFVQMSKLESLSRSGDGCFTILCVLTVIDDESPPLELPCHFEQILRDGTGSDVVLGVAGHEFRAHKSLLAARSSVFWELLFGPKAEKDMLRVEVDDVEPAIFKVMLHYIYTGSLPDCEDEGGYGAVMQDLLGAASSYKLDRLKLICEEELSKRIDQETVTTLSALADEHCCNRLKVACDEFLSSPK